MFGSCSTKTEVVTQTRTVFIRPPEWLFEPCLKTIPPVSGTNADLVQYALDLGFDVESCAAKLDAAWKYCYEYEDEEENGTNVD